MKKLDPIEFIIELLCKIDILQNTVDELQNQIVDYPWSNFYQNNKITKMKKIEKKPIKKIVKKPVKKAK